MKKTILILGAGFMQGVAIRAAKDLGCYVVVVDGNPNAVCVGLADRFEHIDLKDVSALVEFAKHLQVGYGLDAVFTAATDFSFAVAKIAEACGLSGHSVEAADKATDKAKMRGCFQNYGVNSPNFAQFGASDVGNVEKRFAKLGFKFPVVVKPVDNMGARGCEKVSELKNLKNAVQNAVGYSRSQNAIVEEFIDGNEFSLEGLVFDGKLFITAVADRHIYFPPYFVEMGHTIPANISEEDSTELIRVFSHGVKALGLSCGAVKGDIFLKDGKGYVGEIAARLSGGYMSGWTVPYSSGINVTSAAIKLALGKKPNEIVSIEDSLPPLKNSSSKFAAERAWISIPGVVQEVYGLEEAQNTEGVYDVFPRIKKGDAVKFPQNNVEKCGNVLSVGVSYDEAVLSAESATQKILLRLQPNNASTEQFLSATSLGLTVNEFPPDFLDFKTFLDSNNDGSPEKNSLELLEHCRYVKKDDILFPNLFEKYLTTVKDLQGRLLLQVLTLMYEIEPMLFQWILGVANLGNTKIWVKFWSAFIRGGVQGALYVYDSHTHSTG